MLVFGVSLFTRFVHLSQKHQDRLKAELAARTAAEETSPVDTAVRAALAGNDLKSRLNSLDAEYVALASALAEAGAGSSNSWAVSLSPGRLAGSRTGAAMKGFVLGSGHPVNALTIRVALSAVTVAEWVPDS